MNVKPQVEQLESRECPSPLALPRHVLPAAHAQVSSSFRCQSLPPSDGGIAPGQPGYQSPPLNGGL